MLVLRLMGGLGNQMFQYARLLQLSEYYQDDNLVIDLSISNKDKGKPGGGEDGFVLDRFNIGKNIRVINSLDEENIKLSFHSKLYLFVARAFSSNKFFRLFFPIIRVFANVFGGVICQIKTKVYNPLPSFCRKKLIFGYFASEKAFKNVKEQVKNDFRIIEPIEEKNKEFLDQIENCESVCVHVRLGDYVKFAKIYDVLCDDYYNVAINYIKTTVKNPKFFVFSDDIELAKEKYFKNDEQVVFVSNNNTTIQDLILMKSCKHFIIPNSTFSWWAQYLAENQNKIVVAPKKWLNGLPYKDILMPNWITF